MEKLKGPPGYKENGHYVGDDPVIKAVDQAFTEWNRDMLHRGMVDPNNVGIMRMPCGDQEQLFFMVLKALGKI